MSPEVTAIIPTYNRRTMVREAIRSVIAQRGVTLELIVVDDGSTDGTSEDLAELAQTRTRQSGVTIEIIRQRENRGVAAARNLGAAMAQAELIAFLDSDDLWAPLKLKKQVDFMRANPACQIAQTDEVWIRNGRRVNPGRRHQKRNGDFFADALRTCLISPSAVIMRTELFRATGGFDEAMTAAEDYDLWLRVLRDYPAGLLDEPLVTRRAGHPGQLSAEVAALDRFRILALLKLLAAGGLTVERRWTVCDVLAGKCRIYGQGLSRRGHDHSADLVLGIARNAEIWRAGSDSHLERTIASFRAMLGRQRATETPSAIAEAAAP